MAPQPIDAQTMIGRMADAERVQQMAERQPLIQQDRVATQTPTQSAQQETQVQRPEQPQQGQVRETRRREPFAGRRHRRKRSASKRGDTNRRGVSPESATYDPHARKEPAEGGEGHVLDVTA